MSFSKVFEAFGRESTPCVMARAILERAFSAPALNDLFERTAVCGYQRDLLFSSIVDLMVLVACRIRPSVHAAYQRMPEIEVTVKAVYDKLGGMETGVSEALVHYSAEQMQPIVDKLHQSQPWVPGYRTRILDGNCIEATEHRLEILRDVAAGPLPGKTLVVLQPQSGLITDVFCCEDGHAQERSMLPDVLEIVAEKDVWIADRNFCTTTFVLPLIKKSACFVIRRHGNFPGQAVGKRRRCGRIEAGTVYEQTYLVDDEATGETHVLRLITVELNEPTRDGDWTLQLLTNLPSADASAATIAEVYGRRWTIETAFAEIKKSLHAELNTLAYPRAALFSFCVALVAYNVLSVLKAALRAEHGEAAVKEELSAYYVAEEITGSWRGMDIAVPESDWERVRTMPLGGFVRLLRRLAGQLQWRHYRKRPRGPKKPVTPRTRFKNTPHVSIARMLKGEAPARE